MAHLYERHRLNVVATQSSQSAIAALRIRSQRPRDCQIDRMLYDWEQLTAQQWSRTHGDHVVVVDGCRLRSYTV